MKKKRIADKLLASLEEAVQMESSELKGRETFRKLSHPAPKWTKKSIKKLRVEVFHKGQRTPDGAAARLLEILSNDVGIAEKLAS